MNAPSKPLSLDFLKFDNRFLNELPADIETRNFPRQVQAAAYSKVLPTKVSKPQLVSYAKEVAALLGLSEHHCEADYFTQVFAGNRMLKGMEPHATCYGGHQFGHWAGQLGDGRAINPGRCYQSRRRALGIATKRCRVNTLFQDSGWIGGVTFVRAGILV